MEDQTTPASVEGDRSKEAKIARERTAILDGVANGSFETLMARVAWILNHYPMSRDSDVALEVRYWKTFESDRLSGEYVSLDSLYKLTRLTSLSRARAKIQNDYKLFQASDEIKKRRGVLEQSQRSIHSEPRADYPTYSVYVDESGKTSDNLIVGSLWVLHGLVVRDLSVALQEWRESRGFSDELHFSSISNGNVDRYFEVMDILHKHSSVLSFKALEMPRRGHSDSNAALDDMLFHLLIRGVRHEHDRGRAPLPRSLSVWRDAEETARDRLSMANLRSRLLSASNAEFNKKLHVSSTEAIDSKGSPFIQLADLFIGSLNRVSVNGRSSDKPKDKFAQSFLERFGGSRELIQSSETGDLVFIDRI